MTASTLAHPGGRPASAAGGPRAAAMAFGYGLFGLFLFFTCFTFLKPSPYDFTAIPTMLVWFALGIRLHRGAVPFVMLMVVYHAALILALIPYFDEKDPTDWTLQALYLFCTAIFFVMFFSDDTRRRIRFALGAYLASALFASVCGILSYFDVLGDGVMYKMDGRAAGVFEDPNLLGSFLIPSLTYLVRLLVTGGSRRPVWTAAAFLVVVAAEFLSFSRGAWAATAVALPLVVGLTFITTHEAAIRRRIARATLGAGLAGAVALAGLFTIEGVSERFTERAKVTQDYDEGETGRFGNQLRSLPMLVERPMGLGPLRYRLTFNLEPHNSFIGAFANGGWLGGFAFLFLVLATGFVGFRLCIVPSPYQGLAQVVWPALFVLFLQALQIDVEKWRQAHLLLGMVWALEAARLDWLAGGRAGLTPDRGSRPAA